MPGRQPRFSSSRRTTGFTLVELLVVIAILLVLLGIILGVLAKVQKSARQARCLQNLRQIGVAINGFAIQNGGRFPDPASEDLGWEDVVSRFSDIHPLLACPSDEEVFPTIKSSYDWRDTGNPATTLADEMIGSVPGNTVLAFEAMPGWHARNTMNVVLVDGSASTMSAHDALLNLTQPLRTTASSSPSGKGVP